MTYMTDQLGVYVETTTSEAAVAAFDNHIVRGWRALGPRETFSAGLETPDGCLVWFIKGQGDVEDGVLLLGPPPQFLFSPCEANAVLTLPDPVEAWTNGYRSTLPGGVTLSIVLWHDGDARDRQRRRGARAWPGRRRRARPLAPHAGVDTGLES